MTTPPDVNRWSTAEHALEYLRRADSVPHRVDGDAALLEFVSADVHCHWKWRELALFAGVRPAGAS